MGYSLHSFRSDSHLSEPWHLTNDHLPYGHWYSCCCGSHWLFNSDWTWLNKIWKTYGSCIKFPTVIQVNLYFSNVTCHNPWTSRKTCGASTKHPVVRRGKAKTCSFFCGLFPVAWRPWSILQRLGVVCQPKKKHHPKVEKTNNNQKQTPFVNRFYCFLLFLGGGRWGWYHFPHF